MPITSWPGDIMTLNFGKICSFDVADKSWRACKIICLKVYVTHSVRDWFWRKKSLIKYIFKMVLDDLHIFVFQQINIQLKLFLLFRRKIWSRKASTWAMFHSLSISNFIMAWTNIINFGFFKFLKGFIKNLLLFFWGNFISNSWLKCFDLLLLEWIYKHWKIFLSFSLNCWTQFKFRLFLVRDNRMVF